MHLKYSPAGVHYLRCATRLDAVQVRILIEDIFHKL
jgi:hypothetical protein